MAAGIGEGSRVGVWSANRAEAVSALWGIPRAGATAVPLNTRLSVPQASGLCQAAGVELVVHDGAAPDLGVEARSMSAADGGGGREFAATPLVVFTSGTVGSPKGVPLTIENLLAAADSSNRRIGNDAADRWLVVLPLYHIGGISILWRSALVGGTVVIEPDFETARVARLIESEVTLASFVPTMLYRLLSAGAGPCPGLKAALVGGGPIPPGLLEAARAAGINAIATYGMTEMTSQVATQAPGSPTGAMPLLDDVEARVDDDGVLAVRGPMRFSGYLGASAMAPDEWFRTGDLAVLDDDGALTVHGRADTLILSGGENVDPVEVESVLEQHPAVAEAAVFGVHDAEWGWRVGALVVPSAEQPYATDLEGFMRERLADYQVPRQWRFVAELPHNELGKVDRRALPT